MESDLSPFVYNRWAHYRPARHAAGQSPFHAALVAAPVAPSVNVVYHGNEAASSRVEIMSFVPPNSAALSGVKTVMNPALIVVMGLTLFLTGCQERKEQPTGKQPLAQDEPADTDRPLQNMAKAINELKASPDPGRTRQQVGELWIQVEHLKRAGRNTRNVEGLVSDLEDRLGSNQQDASPRRHLANELEYEVDALKRRNR